MREPNIELTEGARPSLRGPSDHGLLHRASAGNSTGSQAVLGLCGHGEGRLCGRE